MTHLYRKRLAGIVCGAMAFLWSGLPQFGALVAHAAELDSQFKGKRQEIRNLELKATQAMIAAAPVCDIFENKLGQLMAAAGPKLITATSAPASTAASTASAYDSAAFADQGWFSQFNNQGAAQAQQQYQDNQQSMGDATTPQVNFQAVTKVITAKDLGLAPDVATVIDSSPELSKLLEETYSAAQTCKPLYTTMVDAESALNTAVNQWIDLAQQLNPSAGTGPRLEANGMWVAVKVRRAAHTAMHTTIPDLKDLAACSGDLFLQQSIPNLFQGLANAEQSLVVKSLSEIMKQSQCLDIKQLVALDSGITWGMIASILAFHSEANAPLRKHLLEGLVMAGAPVLETTKVLGPTGLWMLTQKLLTKEGAHPDYWLLNPDSFLVSYGITVPSREGPHAVTFPICAEEAPVVYSAIEYATPPFPAPSASPEDFSKPVYDLSLFGALFGNSNTPTTPQVIPVDPEEAPLAYGYTLKELKALICPATPSFGPPAGVPVAGPLAKEYLGKCTKAKEITDSYRGDHLGYATCSLPEMMANGYVCKAKLCDAPKAGPSGPFQIENPFGGEVPKPTLPTSCGLPGFQGIPSECQLAGKGSKIFAHATNTKDCANYKQLNLVADPKDPEPIVFEPMEIKGKGPGEGSAESQSSTSTSTDKSTVDKPEKATQPASQQQPQTPATQPASPAGASPVSPPPPPVTPGKDQKSIDEINKTIPDDPEPPIPNDIITTEEEYIKTAKEIKKLEEEEELIQKALFTAVSLKYACSGNDCAIKKKKAEETLQSLVPIWQKLASLRARILMSKFRFVFPAINSESTLSQLLTELHQINNNCADAACRKKQADLTDHITKAPFFQNILKKAKENAKQVLANEKIKKTMKQLREKLLGQPIDDDQYDIAYEGMLSLIDITVLIDPTNQGNVAGYAEDNNIVSIVLTAYPNSPGDTVHELTNTLIHEFILHVLSNLLGSYGYDFKPTPQNVNTAESPDHTLGTQLQKLTGIAMGYIAAPLRWIAIFAQYVADIGGYKQFLSNIPDTSAGISSQSNGPGNNSTGSGTAGGGTSSGGGTPSGGGSGGSGGGGSPQKDCPPDSPNCGTFSPCQLASLAASAKCDMAMGKPGLKLIPGGGLTAPEPKLNKATTDWLNCLFPPVATGYDKTDVFCQEIGGQILCTKHTYHVGPVDDVCQDMLCGEGYIPTIDSKTGVCSCKPEGAGGDPWQGYRGGQDDCQLIICTDNSTHPCCKPAETPEQNRMPEQDRLPQQEAAPQDRAPEPEPVPAPGGGSPGPVPEERAPEAAPEERVPSYDAVPSDRYYEEVPAYRD